MARSPSGGDAENEARAGRPRQREEPPVLPERAAEDRDEAWGDATGTRDDDWYRRERPPHHD